MSTERIDTNEGTVIIRDNSTQVINDITSTQTIDGADASGFGMGQQKQAMQGDISGEKKTGSRFENGKEIVLREKTYIIEYTISGEGASGEAVIYKINADGRPLVLKHYLPGKALPETVMAKIKDNPRDRIVRLYDFGRHDEQDFEIMEYAEGGTLDEYLSKNGHGPIRDPDALRNIVRQLTEGLQQLHEELRIIYQDLKPKNIYFRDKEQTSIILADFGISSVMMSDKDEAEVTANVTPAYAAPELARKGKDTQVNIGPPVDYFALGITMLHIWLGEEPFSNIKSSKRDSMIMNEEVELPTDMPGDYKALIQGLVKLSPKQRWGKQHIQKWLSGESLDVGTQKETKTITYTSQIFSENANYASPAELAELMDKDHDRGIAYLDNGTVTSWIENAGDNYLSYKIKSIVSTYVENKEAGLYLAIYTLDPDRPFISQGGKSCSNTVEIADAIMSESQFYMEELKKKDARLYLYFEAVEGTKGKGVAEELCKNFEIYSPKRALTLVYLKFQKDTGQSINIGAKTYQSPEEIAEETDPGQISLIKQAVQEEDSLFLVWLSDYYGEFFDSTNAFGDMPSADKFFLLGKFSFLSYKELSKNWEDNALNDLLKLITNNPGRFDLFEVYAQQELPFNGQIHDSDWRPTVLTYLAAFFKDIVSDTNTGLDLVRFLHKHGSEINECSGDGSLPLTTAINKRNVPLVSLLLELGASPDNMGRECPPILWALFQNEDNEDESVRIEIANLLLDHKANVNVSHNDCTPLCLTVLYFDCPEKIAFIRRLLDAGAVVNVSDSEGFTPLRNAVTKHVKASGDDDKKNALEVMELLLKKGAKTEVLSNEGYWSPLMRAADANDVDAVNLLLRYGAKKELADADGNIAFVYAKCKKNDDIARLLDPGMTLKRKGMLISAGKTALSVLAIAWVFLTMDVLARVLSSFHFNYPVQLGASLLFSHLLMAYVFVIIFGVRDYLERLKGTFNFVKSGLLYIIGIPIVFPLVIAFLQWLTKKLPEGVSAALSLPADLLTRPSSGFAMLLLYLVFLALPMAAIVVYSKVTWQFDKVIRNYRRFS